MTEYNTTGYYTIMSEIKTDVGMNRDHGLNVWASNIEWMYALADYMWYWCGEILPGYTPSQSKFEMKDVGVEIQVLLDLDGWEDDDVRQVFKVLTRYDDWLRAAEVNY